MATVAIGSLRIDLALATAKFKEGAKKAQDMSRTLANRIKKHSDTIKKAFKAAAAAAAAFAAGLVLAVRGSLKEFDKLAKLSRSIGVPVERLSALQHAADLSGVSLDELGRSFRNVARNMQGAARAPTDFSRSLDALGVSWRDANGNFVRADELMVAVADRFKGMQDGAGKTALAMKIFGEEMGPRLVSMLNSGSDGIKAMTDEAARMGLVVGTNSAVAAEKFNDNLSRLGLQVTAFSNRLTEKLLPTMNHVIQRLLEWAEKTGFVKRAADFLSSGIKSLIEVGLRLGATYQLTTIRLQQFAAIAKASVTGSLGEFRRLADEAVKVEQNYRQQIRDLRKADREDMTAPAGDGAGDIGGGLVLPPRVESAKAEAEALALVNQAEAERLRIMQEMRTPEEEMIARQQHLSELFQGGAKDAQTYGRAMAAASALSAKNMDALASTVSSNLSAIFGESKGVAIAQALINTYQGITRAIATYPPPISTAMAAIQAAAGFAQVANIRKQTKSGGGGSGGGAGAAAGAGASAAAVPQQQQLVSINLEGEKFGREQVRGLIDSLNDAMADGAVLKVA